jgi:uncharacterized iron-regulated membrane protein
MMRKLHRWFGLISGGFMIIIALTGAALQIEMTLNNHPASQFAPPLPDVSVIDPGQAESLGDQLKAAIVLAQTAHPDVAFRSIEVNRTAQQTSIVLGEGGFEGRRFQVAADGQSVQELEAPRANPIHKFLIDVHGGFLFGPVGQIISFLMGLVLILFGVSGLVIYFDMFARRRKIGKKGWFW